MEQRANLETAELTLDANRVEPCKIRFVSNLLQSESQDLCDALAGRNGLVITTPTVMKLLGRQLQNLISSQNLDLQIRVIETRDTSDSSEQKTLHSLERVISYAKEANLSRKSVMIGFGGGVCTDIVGLAAGLVRRGISHFRIPTTLIGQIDAGVGLKCGINYVDNKNYLGLFNPGEKVIIDPGFLKTLPAEHIQEGIAEMIKIAVMCSEDLFVELETIMRHRHQNGEALGLHHSQAIFDSANLMVQELRRNPYERDSYKRLVDFGHCFGPRLESVSKYTIPHGRAVAIDMALSVTLAERLGLLDAATRDRCIKLIRDAGLPVWHPLLTIPLCKAAIRDAELHRGGLVNFPVPLGLGSPKFIEHSESLSDACLQEAIEFLATLLDVEFSQ